MKINDKILVRRAVKEDADSLIEIAKKSFSPEDNLRILGERLTVALFKVLSGLEDSVLLVAEGGNKITGYLWLQLNAFSFSKCCKEALFQVPRLMITALKEHRLKQVFKILKSQSSVGSLCVPYPKIISLAVDTDARRKGTGSMLIAMLEKYLGVKGISDYFVLTSAKNSGAICFYEKNGFEKHKDNKGQIIFCKSTGLKREK